MKNRTKKDWVKIINKCNKEIAESGETVKQWCARKKITYSTLVRWKTDLKKEGLIDPPVVMNNSQIGEHIDDSFNDWPHIEYVDYRSTSNDEIEYLAFKIPKFSINRVFGFRPTSSMLNDCLSIFNDQKLSFDSAMIQFLELIDCYIDLYNDHILICNDPNKGNMFDEWDDWDEIKSELNLEGVYISSSNNINIIPVPPYICGWEEANDKEGEEYNTRLINAANNGNEEAQKIILEEANPITHPAHYCREGAMETIDEMELIFGALETAIFCKLNAWKYRARAIYKNGEEDIKKSDWYLKKYKELMDKWED